ncbi:MAG: gamma-glutamylcyclotransferase [Deltaproteobacteria bacterium]|nr:gamma-glutamylcyclotransferase [Deltaproteobacteria bacterium]
MADIFTYGSLMYTPVWNTVASGGYKKSFATLENYVRRAVINQEYPVVLPQKNSVGVQGVVYFAVNQTDIRRLDEFEGIYYIRKREPVILENMKTIHAEVYILNDIYSAIASDEEWDQSHFEKSGITIFLTNYNGFSR